jgi:hypothetical protein
LELASDLSTDTFLAALRRFISLRGKCAKIYSDHGTNFVGAKRALDELQKLLASQQHTDLVTRTLADDGIQWIFIPPHAPHWGGKWESAVRSVKLHLRRVIGNSVVLIKESNTTGTVAHSPSYRNLSRKGQFGTSCQTKDSLRRAYSTYH